MCCVPLVHLSIQAMKRRPDVWGKNKVFHDRFFGLVISQTEESPDVWENNVFKAKAIYISPALQPKHISLKLY